MSQTADDAESSEEAGWAEARNHLFRMIMEGRSFSGNERNCMFLNTGDTRFGTISGVSGIDFPDDARCIAVTDWDGDGDQDFWISNRNAPRLRLMRNNSNWNNHFLSLRLVGNGQNTNRDAIGARVEVVLAEDGKERSIRTLRAGEGFLSQSSKWLHFGLGRSKKIDKIVVSWPGGKTESFSGLEVDARYRLNQGTGAAEEISLPVRKNALQPSEQSLPAATRVSRVALQFRLPMPEIQHQSKDGKSTTTKFNGGKATVVNLWASWCRPCVEELSELTSRAEELSRAGIEVLSLAAYSSRGETMSMDEDIALMQKLNYAHEWGFVDKAEIEMLQQLHHQLFFLRKSFPLPMTFLIDTDGRLSTIYRGPVTVEQLLADSKRIHGDYVSSSQQAACLPGRSIAHGRVEHLARLSEFHTRYLVGTWLEGLGRFEDALRHFTILVNAYPEWAAPARHLARLHLSQSNISQALQVGQLALKLESNDARIHNTLALIYSRKKQGEKSEFHFREAIRLSPDFAEAHNNLGSMLAGRGNISDAEKHFQKAVGIDDQFAEAHTNLGRVYAAKGERNRATVHFKKAIETDPNYVDAYNNLGTIFASVGQYEQAIEYYQQALKIDAKHTDARRNLQRAKEFFTKQQAKP